LHLIVLAGASGHLVLQPVSANDALPFRGAPAGEPKSIPPRISSHLQPDRLLQ
jgi:hypothetical protein